MCDIFCPNLLGSRSRRENPDFFFFFKASPEGRYFNCCGLERGKLLFFLGWAQTPGGVIGMHHTVLLGLPPGMGQNGNLEGQPQ